MALRGSHVALTLVGMVWRRRNLSESSTPVQEVTMAASQGFQHYWLLLKVFIPKVGSAVGGLSKIHKDIKGFKRLQQQFKF